jgi:hypothetical protein
MDDRLPVEEDGLDWSVGGDSIVDSIEILDGAGTVDIHYSVLQMMYCKNN